MSLFNRQTLKNFFKKGQFPSEVHFGYLIDSVVNKMDDGFAKTEEEGLQLSPTGDSNRVLSIFEQLSDPDALWQIELDKKEDSRGLSFENQAGKSQLYFKDNGHIGINTRSPKYQLDVNGTLASRARVGSFKRGKVDGDGKWHTIISPSEIDLMNTFEVSARIEKPLEKDARSPAAASLHGTALHAYYKGRIRSTRTQFGFPAFFYRLCLRWHGDKDNFKLQIRTQWNYGLDKEGQTYPIEYHITKLWD